MDSRNKSLLVISVGPKTAPSRHPPQNPSRGLLRKMTSEPARRPNEGQPVQLPLAKRRSSSEQQRSKVGFPIRKFSDQSLFAAPRNLSQRTTSFIASQRQGIHQIPLWHLIALIAKARFLAPDSASAANHTLARKDQFCFKRIRRSQRSSLNLRLVLEGSDFRDELDRAPGLTAETRRVRPTRPFDRMRFLFTMSEIERS